MSSACALHVIDQIGMFSGTLRQQMTDIYLQTFPAVWEVDIINVGLAQARPNYSYYRCVNANFVCMHVTFI